MWVTSQRAQRMVAAHWPVDPADLAAVLPRAVMVDTADGVAWLTVIGMQVTHARPRFLPPVPGLSSFAQVGVRTYVTVEGRPAAWIVRGLAGGRLGALLARRVFRLPFEPADVRLTSGRSGHHRPRRPSRGQWHRVVMGGERTADDPGGRLADRVPR